jgi:LmbE family N-acetylglucosaminyl deacetylase
VVVVSPHLDDAVLSLGAAMAAWVRDGARVELLTVFAGDPESTAPAGGWDSRGGFATEGEAVRARRAEDDGASAALGVMPVRLGFGYQDYDRHGDEREIGRAVVTAIGSADVVLLPGSPLSHPDHELLVRTIVGAPLDARRLGFYAEQPYTQRAGGRPVLPQFLAAEYEGSFVLVPVRTAWRDRLAKYRAVRTYRSQLPLLALGGRNLVALVRRPELVAWSE